MREKVTFQVKVGAKYRVNVVVGYVPKEWNEQIRENKDKELE